MRAALAIAAVLLSLPLHAHANPLCDSQQRREELYRSMVPFKDALKERRYADLDRHFNSLLINVKAGQINDNEAGRWFAYAFNSESVAAGPLHREWMEQFPRSQAARIAGAYYYVTRGYAARGRKFASDTAQEQFEAMTREFKRALVLLEEADGIGPKSSLAVSERINMAAAMGGRSSGDVRKLYEQGLRDFPRSLQIRIAYIAKSPPKWGGSIEQLTAIEGEAANLPPADRRYVRYVVLNEIGGVYEMLEQKDLAVDAYAKSLPLCPGFDDALQRLIALYQAAKNLDALLPLLDESIARHPTKGDAYATRGWLYGERKMWERSHQDYKKAAEYGSPYGFSGLAWHYEKGMAVATDYPKAVELYELAYTRGDKSARQKADNVRRGAGIK